MTWSLVVRDDATGHLGIVVATCFFGVGALAPFVESGVGAIATQALVNRFYGVSGLRLLREGREPAEVIAALTARDEGRGHRQVHIVDAKGRTAAFTGADCVPWCGHVSDGPVSVAGNMLAGPRVVEDTLAAYLKAEAQPLAERLIFAMKQGEAAGGDFRGKQSAALVLYGEDEWPDLSLRVDDHPDPLAELDRLERKSREVFVAAMATLPSKRDEVGHWHES